MNKSDSERIKTVLNNINLKETDNEKDADIIIMNTCSVRQRGENRVYSFARKFDQLRKKDNKNTIIIVTGCMAGRDDDGEIKKKLPMVDLFFDINQIIKLPEMLSKLNHNIKSNNPLDEDYLKITPKYQNTYQGFIPIQTGCDQFCTYCVVPFARKRERNRDIKDILNEIRNFAKNGGLEITLLGQIVDKYKIEDKSILSKNNPYKTDFAQLLWEINQIEGIERIHFTAPHPKYINDEAIDALGLPKHINFLHIPVQSGSNKILEKMNRQHTREHYINLIKKIRKRHPNIAIGTDIMVGFCDETEEDFQDTIDLYKECDFDISYTAQYSDRSGTLAHKAFKDNISIEEKKKRWKILHELMGEITARKNKKYKDKVVSVLFDEYRKGMAKGWSKEMKQVEVKSNNDLSGQILDVKITNPLTWILEGQLVNSIESKALPILN